jgi:hypothetical protein
MKNRGGIWLAIEIAIVAAFVAAFVWVGYHWPHIPEL